MNKLKTEKQEMVLNLLVEGNSIRSIERITGIHRDTIMRLIVRVGEICRFDMGQKLRGLNCRYIECDEIWTYVGKKQARLTDSERSNGCEYGDQYVFVAIDRETKLVPLFTVGSRDSISAYWFMQKLSRRIEGEFQLTTDQFQAYKEAVAAAFGNRVHYAMLRKMYHGDGTGREGYSPSALKGVRIKSIIGNPDREKICTSYVERQNLTIRTQCKRFTRLTNAFSKKMENLTAALSIHFWHYNFARLHKSLKTTPAVAAGIVPTILTWRELIN